MGRRRALQPNLRSKLPGALCAGCPAEHKPVTASKPARDGKHRLTLIVERPRYDDEEGRDGILVGGDGRAINNALRDLGIDPRDTHRMVAIACQCRLKDIKEAAKRCRPRVQAELAALEANAPIVAFDAIAIGAAVGKAVTPTMKWRGSCYRRKDGKVVLPMLAPSEPRKLPKWQRTWEGDWQRVGRVMRDGFKPPVGPVHYPETLADTLAAIAELRDGYITFDVETTKDPAMLNRLLCFGLSDGQDTVVIPYSQDVSGHAVRWAPEAWRRIVEAVDALWQRAVMVTHNGPSFDHIVWRRYGGAIPARERWEDTLLMSHAIAGHLPKNLAWVVTNNGIDEEPWKQLETNRDDMQSLMSYNARDCLLTWLARERLAARMQ